MEQGSGRAAATVGVGLEYFERSPCGRYVLRKSADCSIPIASQTNEEFLRSHAVAIQVANDIRRDSTKVVRLPLPRKRSGSRMPRPHAVSSD